MEKLLNELKKELNWKEKIIVTLLKRSSIKIYGIAEKNIINKLL